jgi:hypothetical protein
MTDLHPTRLFGVLAAFGLIVSVPAARAQTGASPSASDSTDTLGTPKHGGGLFGKAKRLAGSKVVKSVAKVAACTMVPGGQAIAGAIDASEAKNAGGAAQGAAAAAAGTSCMPGGGGAGMANAAAAGAAMTGPPQGTTPYGYVASPSQAAADPDPAATTSGMASASEPGERALAKCYGITYEEYVAMVRPTGFENRPMTSAEMKRASKIAKRVGPQRQFECNRDIGMQQGAGEMAAAQSMMTSAETRMAAAQAQTAAGTRTEAPGEMPAVADDPAAELARGTTTVRHIDWVAGGADVSAAARPAFTAALARVGDAMRRTGGRYRIDLYMMDRYDETAVRMYGPGRLATVRQLLTAGGEIPVEAGKVKRAKDPRLEIVRLK